MFSISIMGSKGATESEILMARQLANYLVTHGFIIHTSGSPGVNQSVLDGCEDSGYPERCIVYIPWKSYEESVVRNRGFQIEIVNPTKVKEHRLWIESVPKYHPSPELLKKGGTLLHAVNYGIVANSSKLMVCSNYADGAVLQSIKVAQELNIPIVDFSRPCEYNRFQRVLSKFIEKSFGNALNG